MLSSKIMPSNSSAHLSSLFGKASVFDSCVGLRDTDYAYTDALTLSDSAEQLNLEPTLGALMH